MTTFLNNLKKSYFWPILSQFYETFSHKNQVSYAEIHMGFQYYPKILKKANNTQFQDKT